MESVFTSKKMEIEINAPEKQLLFKIKNDKSDKPTTILLNQNDLFHLMHALLSINRNFNQEKPYFAD
ncbi:hypothetical protein [Paenibacillus sp. KN14-4R]|uniref:hypothetical protein n=1 Tax=Paenibacillus sp. KN14-4R TaxID=3445773 RepID=UPI003F9FFCEE